MTSLTESLREVLVHVESARALPSSADSHLTQAIYKLCTIITTLEQPTDDVERVAGVIESHQHFLDDVAVEGDENEWNDALRQVAAKCIAALTQKHDTPPKGNTHETN